MDYLPILNNSIDTDASVAFLTLIPLYNPAVYPFTQCFPYPIICSPDSRAYFESFVWTLLVVDHQVVVDFVFVEEDVGGDIGVA